MENRSANAFLMYLAKCLKEEGVTNHAIRQAYKRANLSAGERLKVTPKDNETIKELLVGLATAYYDLE